MAARTPPPTATPIERRRRRGVGGSGIKRPHRPTAAGIARYTSGPMAERRDGNPPEEDFAAMLAAADRSERAEHRPRRARLAVGDRVRGKGVSIGSEVTVVEIDGGGEGTLETVELRDDGGELTVAVGHAVEARVVGLGEKEGIVSLRRGAGAGRGRPTLAEAAATGAAVEGLVAGV